MNYHFDKKDVFSWSNAEEARQYIGKEGYFSDYYRNDLECWLKAKLIDISCDSGTSSVFTEECGDEEDISFGLFLPADKVKKVEKSQKKLRPFTSFVEFYKTTGAGIGSVLTWRAKGTSAVLTTLVTSVMFADGSDSNESVITLGDDNFTLDSLFNDYEYQGSADNWRPFGIEAEVEE